MKKLTMGTLLCALALGACGSDGGGDANGDGDTSGDGDTNGDGDNGGDTQTLRIGWVPKSLNNVVFETGRDGAFLRAKEINADPESDVKIEVVYDASEMSDATAQAAVIDKLVAEGVDGLGVSCNDTEICGAAIDRAVAAGVEVMTWDSDAPASKRFTYYSADNHQGGIEAAKMLGKLLEGKGKVALISGNPDASNLNARRTGFEEEIAASFPEIEIVATVYGNDDTDMSAAAVEGVMAEHPDLNGWFFVGLWSLLADDDKTVAWREAADAGNLKTVVFDTPPFELDLLKEGQVHGLVGQKYWGWGYDTVTMLRDRIVDKKKFEAFTDSGLDLVCANNADQMSAMWASNNFTQPLEACSLLK
jgi:ribose transport system substrate-binding protein